MLRSVGCAAIAALLLALTFASAATAHSELKSASPGPDDTVVGSPPELVARFSQNLDRSRTSLEVRAVDGARVAQGGAPGTGKREFRLTLPELAPGKYEVRWTSFSSEDGELARGSYSFTVVAAPIPTPDLAPSTALEPSPSASTSPTATTSRGPSPSTSPASTASPTTSSASDVILPIVAALVLVTVFGAWLLRRRRS